MSEVGRLQSDASRLSAERLCNRHRTAAGHERTVDTGARLVTTEVNIANNLCTCAGIPGGAAVRRIMAFRCVSFCEATPFLGVRVYPGPEVYP